MYVTKPWSVVLLNKKHILLSQVYCVWQVVKTPTIVSNNPVFSKRWQLNFYVPIANSRFQITLFGINQYIKHRRPLFQILEFLTSFSCYFYQKDEYTKTRNLLNKWFSNTHPHPLLKKKENSDNSPKTFPFLFFCAISYVSLFIFKWIKNLYTIIFNQ